MGLAALASVGCWKAPSFTDPEPELPYKGITLTMACSEAVREGGLLEQLARDWSARTGARVQIRSEPLDDGTKVDLGVITPPELSHWAVKGALQELPGAYRSSQNKFLWSELPLLLAEKLLRWDGKAYALPLLGEGHVLVYRTDLFAEKEAEFEKERKRQLAPPETWEEFVQIARFFHDNTGKPSLPPLPERADDLDRLFYTIAIVYDRPAVSEAGRAGARAPSPAQEDELFSFHFSLASGEPRVNRPAFVHALELLQEMQPCRPAGAAAAPSEDFRRGASVLCLARLDALARFQAADSPVRDRFAIAPIPGSRFTFAYHAGERGEPDRKETVPGQVNRVPYVGWGGCFGVVTTACSHPDVAWEFLAALGNPAGTSLEVLGAAKWGAGPFRGSHLEARNRNYWYSYGLSNEQTGKLVDQLRHHLVSSIVNYGVRLRVPDEKDYSRAMDEELREALLHGAPAKAALDEAAKRWKVLGAARPGDGPRETYRKSLGL
jgi:multiple sugar transport system substrate-binding protein